MLGFEGEVAECGVPRHLQVFLEFLGERSEAADTRAHVTAALYRPGVAGHVEDENWGGIFFFFFSSLI